MTIGQRLREEREALGLSQPKFAALAGTTKQTLFSWESDRTAPSAAQLAAFAQAGVDVFYVLSGTRQPQPETSLSDQEKSLIDLYRTLSQADQQTVQRTVAALAATSSGE